MKTLEKRTEERRKELTVELMPLGIEDVEKRFDELLESQSTVSWPVTKDQTDAIANDIVPLIERLEYPMSMSGVVVSYLDKFSKKVDKITFQDVKLVHRFLTDSKFTGYEQAKSIQNILKAFEPLNMAVADIEIDVHVVNEILTAKEQEKANGVWHELTKAWAAEYGVELPEAPEKE